MSDLEPKRGSGMTRQQRADRAYKLAVAGSVSGAVAIVGAILSVLDVLEGNVAGIAAIIAVVCFVLFRRTIRG